MKKYDVFGVGNALVDTLAFIDDDFLRERDLNRGVMTLVDAETQGRLLLDLQHTELTLRSGGSACNTMITIAQSGGTAFYTGKVSRDTNGEFYRQDLLQNGVHFDVHPAPETSGPTGSCLVLTTPDAERTMYTHLGVSTLLDKSDINIDRLHESKYIYLEGYLWDSENPRAACVLAMEEANRAGIPVSYTFSDPFCVGRFRDDFHMLLKEHVNVLFCNADEARQFSGKEIIEEAAAYIGSLVKLAFITNSEKGAFVVSEKNVSLVPGFPVHPLDTNGAGDAFAGGVLFALAANYSPQKAARWGNYRASQIVQVPGARLEGSQSHLVKEILGVA